MYFFHVDDSRGVFDGQFVCIDRAGVTDGSVTARDGRPRTVDAIGPLLTPKLFIDHTLLKRCTDDDENCTLNCMYC